MSSTINTMSKNCYDCGKTAYISGDDDQWYCDHCWNGEEEEEEGSRRWWKVDVIVDGELWQSFLTYMENEEEARYEIAFFETDGYEGDIKTLELVASPYEGETAHLNTHTWYPL